MLITIPLKEEIKNEHTTYNTHRYRNYTRTDVQLTCSQEKSGGEYLCKC